MKKYVAMILMVASLTMITAQAEVKLKGQGYEWNRETETYDAYVIFESDTGATSKLYVTEDELYEINVKEFKRVEDEARQKRIDDFVDMITFWN